MIQLPATLDGQLRREEGITHFDYVVMSTLALSGTGSMRLSDLADSVGSSLSRLSHTISRLERRGWLTRAPDPLDRRCTLAQLTDGGWEKVIHAAPGHTQVVRELVFDVLTGAEAEQLRVAGDRIVAAIEVRRERMSATAPVSPDVRR